MCFWNSKKYFLFFDHWLYFMLPPYPAFHSDVTQYLGIGSQTGLRGPYGKVH